MSCDKPNKCTALPQYVGANELSSLTGVRMGVRSPNSRSYGFPYEPFVYSCSPRKRKKGGSPPAMIELLRRNGSTVRSAWDLLGWDEDIQFSWFSKSFRAIIRKRSVKAKAANGFLNTGEPSVWGTLRAYSTLWFWEFKQNKRISCSLAMLSSWERDFRTFHAILVTGSYIRTHSTIRPPRSLVRINK